ncbi:putative transcriptional activator [Leptospirillum ferrooxidans C2-3]|uniref:Putative transcriptional activator n=1 Tax=Leptospirillum ferrooxidans (strain C2-3) TaxID=1162668 RepID=I0IPT9_LEPFC|nr:putative transcriptional activator [Leptospirillum ferrooxidans C2-3]
MKVLTNLSDLSKSDLVSLSEIVYLSTSVRKKEELGDLLRVVTHLIPTTGVVAGLPSKDPRHDSIIETERYMNVSYSISWLTLYQERKFHLVDPIFQNHFEYFGRQVWSETYKRVSTMAERKFIETSLDFDLDDGVTLGQRSYSGKGGSTFSFAGNEISRHSRHLTILDLLSPHLHAALSNIFLQSSSAAVSLTNREKEVLIWIKEGKTNWEISQILKVSERTIVFHMQNAMRKLGARNRVQAMATALSLRLIE